MARRVKLAWSPEARDDLKQIYAYIAADDVRAAKRFVTKIKQWAQRLVEQPEIGRVVPDLDQPDLRERILESYHIIYRRQASRVEIVTIWHSAQEERPER